jgi:pimeloyl-ACP methyl ester carboxylesterase
MPALAERFTVIAPDLPGLGTSSPPPSYDKRTIARLVRDLVRQLGHARAFVVGHDMGAAVAYAYAAAYPDEVPRLVFMESLVPGFGLERITDPANGGSWHFGFQGTPEYAVPLVSGRERMYLTAQVMGVTVNPEAMRAPLEEYIRAYDRPTVLRAGFEYYRALIGQDARDNRAAFRGKLRMPMLAVAVTGKNAGLPDALRAVAADVRPLIVDRSGHFVHEERPVFLARRLTAFLADSAR